MENVTQFKEDLISNVESNDLPSQLFENSINSDLNKINKHNLSDRSMHTIGENDFKEANRLNDFDYLEKGLEGETGMSTSNMVVYYDQDYESQDDNHN